MIPIRRRFVIAENDDKSFSILYQTDGTIAVPPVEERRFFQRDWRTAAVVHSGIRSLDSAKICLKIFQDWLKWHSLSDELKVRCRKYHIYVDFDPFTENFQTLVDRYELRCIDDDITNLVFYFLNNTFGENGGWDINKAYKLQTETMLNMWLMGYCATHKLYGNKFQCKDFYESARNGLEAVVSMYGNRVR